MSLLGSRASYRNIRCRSKQLTKKNTRRREPALRRHEADRNELARARIDLHMAARQRWIRIHGLAVGDLGGLLRTQVGRGPPLERRFGRQQQAVQGSGPAARGGLELG